MKKLNVAIVGCGVISQTHIDAVKKYPNAQVYAVCDIDELKAGKVAWEQDCRYYTDFEEMLEAKDIDVVHVCTPHYLHFPMVCKSLEKGKHVFTEKPLGLNERECRAMKSAAEASEFKAAVCMQNR
ncbi:MAG: Gfo/Idh/MocA family protein, partial [Cellulosilyticaceae bacterium]